MTFEELEDEILILVDSGTTSMDDEIPDLINDAVKEISLEPGIILPSLKSIQSVSTVSGQAYTTLPSGFDGKLLFASFDGVKVEAHKTLEDLLEDYPDLDEEGDVEAVALEGQTLWYVKIPSDVTAMGLLLYATPTELTAGTDVPSCIPAHLHRRTIVPLVASYMFDKLEQGDDGDKTNTLVQRNFYEKGIEKLREYLAARRRGMTRSIWNI